MKEELVTKENKKKIYFWITVNVIFLTIAILLVWQVFNLLQTANLDNNKENIINKEIENSYEGMVRRAIDGVYVKEGEENFYPVAFMIDNHTDARLSANLGSANLVYEAEVEGGITRFMAIYTTNEEIEKIGPIRSARPYFIDWAHELSSVYGHCGGSPEALVKITRDGIIDFNEFYNSDYFWRSDDKIAPHNIYISSESIQKYLKKKKLETGNFLSWKFKEDIKKEDRPNVHEIKIGYVGKNFQVGWAYTKEENDYIRHMGGKIHKDESDVAIHAKNIIIQYIPAKEIDSKLRLKMDVVGEGEAVVCFDGKCDEAIWKKKNTAARTRFYFKDKDNDEVEFNAGKIWIEVVRPEREVEFN
ncbi:DUF3048 domain-containing protein [Candidatus Parcubacteria bacterium]|nr:DUF3048 domain-containing protein [Candidatus Parcubacteria bacterium]